MKTTTKRIGVTELASQLSLSVGTVSQALNGIPRVNEQTRQRVLRAAQKAGYVPNRQARALRENKSRLIGLLVPSLNDPIYLEQIASAQDGARENGYDVFFASSQWNREKAESSCNQFLSMNIDGLIIDSALKNHLQENAADWVQKFINRGTAILQIIHDESERIPSTGSILLNTAGGACAATRHLIELGHTSIALAGIDPAPNGRHSTRMQGIHKAIEKAEHPVHLQFVNSQYCTLKSIYEDVRSFIRNSTPDDLPTAFQVVDDQAALGVLKALADEGLKVPEQISVCGFNNSIESQFYQPGLTTVSQTHLDLGRKAVQAILKQISEQGAPRDELLELELIIRESTGPAPHRNVGNLNNTTV